MEWVHTCEENDVEEVYNISHKRIRALCVYASYAGAKNIGSQQRVVVLQVKS